MHARRFRLLVLAFPFLLTLAPPESGAVPPVPGKQGTAGPREGFSTARLRPDYAGLPETGQRLALEPQGTINVLAVRVGFSDAPIQESTAYYGRVLFFMNQYWNQATDGVVTLNSTLSDSTYTLPNPMSYYGDDDRFQERLVHMVRDLVVRADPQINFSQYQSLVIFHAGQGQEADVKDDSREQIWSAFVTPDDFRAILPDSTGAVGIETNDLISGGVPYRVREAVILPESESQDGYDFGMTGVACHEFGHQLGLPDLYDTTPDENGYSQGIGSWDIMGTGVWNANGYVPALPSAWSRAFLGRSGSGGTAPLRVIRDGAYVLSQVERQVGASPRLVEIPIGQSEYFLLENRRQDLNGDGRFNFDDANLDGSFDFYSDSYAGAEFDYFLPGDGAGSGLLIYHVDEAKIAASLATNTVNGDTARKGIDLEEADGIQDLDEAARALNSGSPEDAFRAGERDRFGPDTNPSSEAYGHIRTGISVTGVGAPDSLMSFTVGFDRNRPGWPVALPLASIRDAPPLAADLNGDAVLELILPVGRTNNTGALYVLRPDGTDFLDRDANPATREAFAITSAGDTRLVTSPCVGDIDGDGDPEIVFRTQNGATYAYHHTGAEVLDGDGNAGTTGVLIPGGAVTFITQAQPILADLDGDGAMEIVHGSKANALGGSSLIAHKLQGSGVVTYSVPMGGSTEAPPTAADVNGDGFPELIVANTLPRDITGFEENLASGFSIADWKVLEDPNNVLRNPEDYPFYLVVPGIPFAAPVAADLDRDGDVEVVAADTSGAIHVFGFEIAPHLDGDPPVSYVTAAEKPGWPRPGLPVSGEPAEASLGDLEGDGHPEIFQTGARSRVVAYHYNGAPRSGFPLEGGDPLAPADSAGVWPPLVADVDGDGRRDVVAILGDGRRVAYRADGSVIPSFGEVGSTASGPPPILADLDGDGIAEWIEAYDQGSQVHVHVRRTTIAASGSWAAWTQYRRGGTRDGALPTSPAPSGDGTTVLSEVYAYPNPSSTGATTIHYRLSSPARSVRVEILDPAGTIVAEPAVGVQNLAGSVEHAVIWSHASVASGVYVCRVEVKPERGATEVAFTKLAIVR